MTEKPTKANILCASKLDDAQNYVLIIHGGATHVNRQNTTLEMRARYKAALTNALKAGYEVLKLGGEAMDAAVAAVTVLEDHPLFNSGKGAAFNIAGKNELEASIMLSKPPATHPTIPATRRGISAALLTRTKNPSHLVRALYLAPELAPHPILSGPIAESIGEQHFGIQTVDPSYFWAETRWNQHRIGLGLPVEPIEGLHGSDAHCNSETTEGPLLKDIERDPVDLVALTDLMPKGTVGVVALDVRGCIATVTSTGGRTNKLVGRIGDTAIMGAGFWAEEWTRKGSQFSRDTEPQCGVGVSGTGDGDCFIRVNAASMLAHRMRDLGEPLHTAAQYVIDDLSKNGGIGGLIAVDKKGNVTLPFNAGGMCRGVVRTDGIPLTAVFSDDELSQ